MSKVPEKLYLVKNHKGRVSKAYKHKHHAKENMNNELDELVTYTIESSSNLKEIKREKRLSTILDGKGGGFPTKDENTLINLFKTYVLGNINPKSYAYKLVEKKLNRMTDRKELKTLITRHKYKLLINLETIEQYEILFKFHNFRNWPSKNEDMILQAKKNIKKQKTS